MRSLLINECPEAGLSLLFISETEDAEGRVGVEVVVGSALSPPISLISLPEATLF